MLSRDHRASPFNLCHLPYFFETQPDELKKIFSSTVPAVISNVLYAASIFFLATAGATFGLIIGVLAYPKTLSGFIRGTVMGLMFGTIYSVKLFKWIFILWQSDNSSGFSLSMLNSTQAGMSYTTSTYNVNGKMISMFRLRGDVLDPPGADEISCPICLQGLQPAELIGDLPLCHHRFHKFCLRRWLEEHNTCPLCRNTIIHVQE